MTIKEAILKSLEDIIKPCSYKEVYQNIISKNYYSFDNGKTPEATISALLGDFIRQNDSRVKRLKDNGSYFYYLTANENNINIEQIDFIEQKTNKISNKKENYLERSLHKLLSSYVKYSSKDSIYTKTIFHEKSTKTESNQKWLHPDMVGIKLTPFKQQITEKLLKVVNTKDRFRLYSYELKRTINTDYELKEAYFQAVSNSSWANYGYLVAYEIAPNLKEEMERLNQSFGIGIIELNSNPYESDIMVPAQYKELDFRTIDKICNANEDFLNFIDNIEKILTVPEERYYNQTIKEFEEFCDDCFNQNSDDYIQYCQSNHIPSKDEIE